MKNLASVLALSLAIAGSSYVGSATALPMKFHSGNSDLILARQGPDSGGRHPSAGMRRSDHAMRGPSMRSSRMTSAHVSKQPDVIRGQRNVTHRGQVSTYRGKTVGRHAYGWSGKNVKHASAWHVRNWHHHNYYGRVAYGVSIGTIILVAGVPPIAPAPDLCWYWADYSYNRGYWDYCYY